mgnify:CR=1 FL=1|jgi:asparagine synthase (glutamine-hydrolysing)
MATRFIAIVGANLQLASDISSQITSMTGLSELYAGPNLTLLVNPGAEVVAAASNAVYVVGHLFSRSENAERILRFKDATAIAIKNSSGDTLTQNYWGGYCAFIDDEEQNRVVIQRDPSGMMPCFYLTLPGVTFLTSDIETLWEADLLPVEIDWPGLAAWLDAIDFPYSRTALAGVFELLAGHRLTVTDGVEVQPCWSPWDHVRPISRTAELPERLYQTVHSTVRGWGRSFDKVIMGVSGGLDSSIVVEGLADSTCGMTAYTMATQEAGGDERHYARMVASAFALPLRELLHKSSPIDFSVSTAADLPRPGGGAFSQSHTLDQLALGTEMNVGAYFTGIGGDNVFCFMQSATPFLDRLMKQGPMPGTAGTLLDICKLTDCSVWDVIAMAYRKWRRGNTYQWPAGKRKFLSPEQITPALHKTHPWLNAPRDALPGKAVHIAMLARVQATLDTFPRKTCAPQIHPLLSQPIVELCLQVPTWEWCAGGQNRSVARRAFAGKLPGEILSRRSKGSPDAFAFDVLQANRSQIRDLLVGGQLDQNGLIHRDALTAALKPGAPIVAPDHVYLYAIAEAEAWVRTWQNKARKRSTMRRLA